MSTGLFAFPDNLVIDFKKVPVSLFDEKTYSPLNQIENDKWVCGKNALDMDKAYTTGEEVSMFRRAKMFGYFLTSYLHSWEVFLFSILKQNPDAPLIEFHFVYPGDGDDRPFFFRAIRNGSQLKFFTFVGEGNEPWCSSIQDIDEKDEDEWDDWYEALEKNKQLRKSEDEGGDEKASKKIKTNDDESSTTTEKTTLRIPQKLKLDLAKYRAGYNTHVEQYIVTEKEKQSLEALEALRTNMWRR